MKLKNNPLIASGLVCFSMLIALLYIFINFNKHLILVFGVSALFITSVYFFLINIFNLFKDAEDKKSEEIKSQLTNISNELIKSNLEQLNVNKATYVYTKKSFQNLRDILNNNEIHTQKLINSSNQILESNIKTSKLLIKYNDSNTNKLVSNINNAKSTISNSVVQGFDQTQLSNDALLEEISNLTINIPQKSSSEPTTTSTSSNSISTDTKNNKKNTNEPSTNENLVVADFTNTSDDPNKQLSPDEIAALFASVK